ncbi:hypothetical protein AYK20_08985 [Thermoplasmatales archaeon SG8-52-1]|nr:MAG: hypothetical protein AYK20_08985 [Thermoplasmatales archaeon SG8-52-1]
MKKLDDKAQGSNLLMLMILMMLMIFIMPTVAPILASYLHYVLMPLIGFDKQYPVLTLFFAGLIVVFLSSLLTNFFTDWKKMGESQEMSRAFQKEITKARREGNTNRVNKLMKMQPEIMRKQTEASGGMMKPMLFLIIFIWPIFIWLRTFLASLPHYYLTVPWANQVSFFSYPFNFGQAWLWLYLLFSMAIGQIIRQGLKYISWSNWWKNVKSKIRPSVSR